MNKNNKRKIYIGDIIIAKSFTKEIIKDLDKNLDNDGKDNEKHIIFIGSLFRKLIELNFKKQLLFNKY